MRPLATTVASTVCWFTDLAVRVMAVAWLPSVLLLNT